MISTFFESIGDFLASGGDVLTIIFFTTLLLWVLIAERFLFFSKDFPKMATELKEIWGARTDRSSWKAKKIREYFISKTNSELNRYIPFINTLVAACPLLGLLGTVTGMIAVFDTMAISGTGNARLMASGISMATIPTMAGMVAALSGIYFSRLFEGRIKKALRQLEDELDLNI